MDKDTLDVKISENAESSRLEQMIRRILDIDSQAREMTARAETMKLRSDKTVQEEKARLRADYMERANRRIEIVHKQERAWAEEALAAGKAQYARQLEEFDRKAQKEEEGWVSQIVERSLEL